jgi:hypothetical protein
MSSSIPTEDVAPSGWYDDPVGANFERYWDGAAWTDQLRPRRSGGSGGAVEDSHVGPEPELRESTQEHPPAAESARSLLDELRRGRLLLVWLALLAVAQLAVAWGSARLSRD